jgi:polyisoprenoid-binding protein YceI
MDAREFWRVDPERSKLSFSIDHALLGKVRGHFDCWGGSLLLDKDRPWCSAVRMWIDLSSVNTGSDKRDRYILDTELFDVNFEPGLVFDSERVEIARLNRGIVVGRLSVRSFSDKVKVAVEAKPARRDATGRPHAVYAAHASIDRIAIGLRRSQGISDWLGERVLGRTIQIAAHIEVMPDDLTTTMLPNARPPTGTQHAFALA